jgi:hypothetical protein
MVPGVDRRKAVSTKPADGSPLPANNNIIQPQNLGADYLAAQQSEASQSGIDHIPGSDFLNYDLAPRSQAVAAVAEDEWEKQGIAFQSRAERGAFGSVDGLESKDGSFSVGGGATILSNFMRQSLIHDQYERTVREQDEALRSRVDKARNERQSIETEQSQRSHNK